MAPFLLALPLVWISVSRLLGHAGVWFPADVARGETGPPARRLGYAIQQYRWRGEGYRITLWAGQRFQLTFNEPRRRLERVRTQKWLGNDRAVLLELDDTVQQDSMSHTSTIAVLYDFERGELHTHGNAAWLAVPSDRWSATRQMSRQEFEALVEQLNER